MTLTGPRSRLGWICSLCQKRAFSKQAPHAALPQRHDPNSQRQKVPNQPTRTRFAPSPTGNIHLGSIRTALFNYLLAKRTKGEFLLRIEDTDQKRTVAGAEERIYEDLRWAGLLWDEGPIIGGPYGPYKQSERKTLYHEHIRSLLASKKGYRCFCSVERIDELNRSRQERGLPLGYDRRCAELSDDESSERAHKGHSHVVRFRAPDEYPKYDDFVYGRTGQGKVAGRKLHIDQPVYDDPVLMKSDGHPTYHFANVVDDHLMKITHVLRGSEWMSSTPLHVALYAALGWDAPAFGHVPLLVNSDGQKLSKRHLDLDVSSFRYRGIYPEALVNFAALLGWSHQRKSDVMTLRELEQVFDLKFTKGNTIVSFDKLDFLGHQHTRRYIEQAGEAFQKIVGKVSDAIEHQHSGPAVQVLLRGRRLEDVVAAMLRAGKNDYTSPSEFAQRCAIYFKPVASSLSLGKPESYPQESLATAAAALCFLPAESWTAAAHRQNILALQPSALGSNIEPKVLQQTWKREFHSFLRNALLGGAPGPTVPETMEILGKEICTERIRSAALIVRSREALKKPHVKVHSTPLAKDHLHSAEHAGRLG